MPVLAAILTLIICSCGLSASSQYSWQWGRSFSGCTFSHAGYVRHLGYVVFDEKIPAQPGEENGVGVVETPEIVTAKPFAEAIPSWNACTPEGSYLVVLVKVRANGRWSKWCKLDVYNSSAKPEPRASCIDGDDIIFSETSAVGVVAGKRADAVRLRFELRSTDGKTYPILRYIGVNTNDPTPEGWNEAIEPTKSVWGTELDVPYLCQLSVPGGSVWCSPTSTAMVLGYWSKQLSRPDLTVGITEAATGIRDNRWGGTGHWGFNAAYAGEFKGIRAYVDRFSSVARIEQAIARGVPVIVSLDYNRLNRRDTTKRMGHLMVIRRLHQGRRPGVQRPWAHLEKGEQLRKVFKRADLEYAARLRRLSRDGIHHISGGLQALGSYESQLQEVRHSERSEESAFSVKDKADFSQGSK